MARSYVRDAKRRGLGRRRERIGPIIERLAADPWSKSGLLVTKQISPWRLRLGTLE